MQLLLVLNYYILYCLNIIVHKADSSHALLILYNLNLPHLAFREFVYRAIQPLMIHLYLTFYQSLLYIDYIVCNINNFLLVQIFVSLLPSSIFLLPIVFFQSFPHLLLKLQFLRLYLEFKININ